MPIILVCSYNYDTKLIIQYPSKGSFPKIEANVEKILTGDEKKFGKKSIEDKDNNATYHYSSDNLKVYMCVTSCDTQSRIAYGLLTDIEPILRNNVSSEAATQKTLKQKMDFYNDPQNDKIASLQRDIDNVKDTMVINIDKVLERGDRLDTLSSKSQTLAEQANKFQAKATELKRLLCMRNAKLAIMVSTAVIVVILIILMIACNPNFSKCKS
jgi:vesicle-associated membrane protein 7